MTREINIRLNANRAKVVHTGYKFASGDKGIVFKIAVEELETAGTTAKIVFKRSNGTSVEASVEGEDGIYSYTTLGNEFAVIGLVVADVKFYEEGKRISTCTFDFGVTSDTMDGIGTGAGGYSDTLETMKESMEQTEEDMAQLDAQLKEMYETYAAAFGTTGTLNPRGTYNASTAYKVRDLVTYNEEAYICMKNCTGATPSRASQYWMYFGVTTREARNLVPFPYYEKAGTESGITWTVNSDGTIRVKGTATANASFTIRATSENWTIKKGTYTLGGCPMGGSFTGYRLQLARFIDGTLTSYANDYGNGVTFEITDDFPLLLQFVVASGVTIDAIVEPMLESGSVKHPFVPYYFGCAENADKLDGYDSSDFLKTNENGGTVSFNDYIGFKVKRKTDTDSAGVGITFSNNKGMVGMMGFKNRKLTRTDVSTWAEYEVFDKGNKPSGTYTGDGTERTVAVAEPGKTIGSILHIETERGFGFVCSTGGVYYGPETSERHEHFDSEELNYNDGSLYVQQGAASSRFNQTGEQYKYNLL